MIVVAVDMERDSYQYAIDLYDLDANRRASINLGNARVRCLRFSPNGQQIAWYLADGTGAEQLCCLPNERVFAARSSARVVIEEGSGLFDVWFSCKRFGGELFWMPTGDQVCTLVSVKEQALVKVYESLRYKTDGLGLLGREQTEIWLVGPGGASHRVYTWPGPIISAALSHDGSRLAFSVHQDSDHTFFTQDMYVLELTSSTETCVFKGRGPVHSLSFSPTGREVAWIGHTGPRWNDTTDTLWLTHLDTGETRHLVEGFDRPTAPYGMGDISPGRAGHRPLFHPSGETLWHLGASGGVSCIYQLTLQSGAHAPVPGPTRPCVNQVAASAAGDLLYTATDPTHPDDLYLLRDGCEIQLSDHNAEVLADVMLVEPERLVFRGADGWEIEGWLMLPAASRTNDPRRGAQPPYPLVLVIHGGPHNAYGYGFQMEFQTLCAAGFAVLYVNPRGSQTYGQVFASAVLGDWGGKDYEDLMAAVDELVRRGIADPDRLGVTGYSYGGYMTNWIVTQTNRFRAAVSGGGISNLVSFQGTSDIGPTWAVDEHGVNAWQGTAVLWQRSPLAHVQNVETPLLLYHAEGDDRCPIGQSEEFYSALRSLRKPAVFVRYPVGSHLFGTQGPPSQRIDKLTRVVGWFTQHLLNNHEEVLR